MRRSLALAILVGAIGTAQGAPRAVNLDWMPGAAIQDAGDRALAAAWMKEQFFCSSDPAACGDFEVARIGSPSTGGGLLALRTASGGTCGTYEVALYGPVGPDGTRRRKADGSALLAECVNEVALRFKRGWPDIVTTAVVDRFAAAGPALEMRVWRRSADAYRVVSRSRERIR